MEIEVLADPESVARKAAGVIAAEARAAIAAHGRFVVAVSGGHTPWIMLRHLADEDIPWTGVHIVQVDERVAPTGHLDRNLTHLQESLLEHAPLRFATSTRRGSSRSWARRTHRLFGAGRCNSASHQSGCRPDRSLPRQASDELDVSDHQPISVRALVGYRS
jgi:hypothetical protein